MIKKRTFKYFVIAIMVIAISSVVVAVRFPYVVDIFGFVIGGALNESPSHLSDNKLIASFRDQRAVFDQLREMISHDVGLMRVSTEFTLPEFPENIGVGSERLSKYRTLLKLIGASSIAASSDRKTIEIAISVRGFAGRSSVKGYTYVLGGITDREIFNELDQFSASEVGAGLRRIDGNWYLYFEGY